jgi:hypothetical protein
MNKPLVVRRVRDSVARLVEKQLPGGPVGAACLLHAGAVVAQLRAYGVPAVLQAGSAGWVRVPPELDDGVSPNAFSYEFLADARCHRWLAAGMLPEMHCWAAVPATGELIDVTTCFQPGQCRSITGMDWPGPPPPDFVWADRLPPGCYYRPDPLAIKIVAVFLCRVAPELFGGRVPPARGRTKRRTRRAEA